MASDPGRSGVVAAALAVVAACGGRTSRDGHAAADADAAALVGVRISERYGTRLQLVSDCNGNALAMWDVRDEVDFARWNAATREWTRPASLRLGESFLVDTHGSGHPILTGEPREQDAAGAPTTVVYRFDPGTDQWSPPQASPVPQPFVHRLHISMDGAGNAYAYWNGVKEFTYDTAWWPVAGAAWRASTTVSEANGMLGARGAGAWLWQDRSGLGARQFDVDTGQWRDEVEIEQFRPAPLETHSFDVGPSGEALLATLRREPAELVLEAHRYDAPGENWLPVETLTRIGIDSDPTILHGPLVAYANAASGDLVIYPVPTGDRFDIRVQHRAPNDGRWSDMTVVIAAPDSDLEFVADDLGNLYGLRDETRLLHFSAARTRWTTTDVDQAHFRFTATRNGAFAVGLNSSFELVAYRHPGGDGVWRRAEGLPAHVAPEIGSVAYAVAAIGNDRALLIWPTRAEGGSIRALFLE